MPTLIRLVTLGAEGLPTRRRVPLRGLERRERQVIDGFVDARLVVTRDHDGEAVAEVAHEALRWQWTPLKDAIDRSRSDLTLRAEIERAALDRERSSDNDEYLLTGLRFVRAGRLSGSEGGVTFKRFIATSRERQQRSHERATTRRRWTLIAAAVVVTALTVFGINRLDWSANQFGSEPNGFTAPPTREPTPPPGEDWEVVQTDDGIYKVDFDPSTDTEGRPASWWSARSAAASGTSSTSPGRRRADALGAARACAAPRRAPSRWSHLGAMVRLTDWYDERDRE